MATSLILSEYVGPTTLTITLASLANNAGANGRQSVQVVDTTPSIPLVRVHAKVTTTGSPGAGNLIEFYVARSDGTLLDGGTGTGDAAFGSSPVDTYEKSELELVHTQPVSNSAATYISSFLIREPGPRWALVVVNGTATALDASAGNHSVTYETITPEVQ